MNKTNNNNNSSNSDNNKSSGSSEKNNFPVVLCSGIAVLVVATLYFTSYNKGEDLNNSNNSNIEQDNLSVNSSDIKSYTENILDKNNNYNTSDYDGYESVENNILENNNQYLLLDELIANNTAQEDIIVKKDDDLESQENNQDTKENTENTENIESTESTENTKENNKLEDNLEEKSSDNNSDNNSNSNIETETNSTTSATTFNLFDNSKEMTWPVSGQIVMNYSTETAIYDKTLDLYRTNDSICISAPEGTEVLASADGIVENIFIDNQKGTSVVINHGNGWLSTYGQLTEDVDVSVGQIVDMGEQIGNISLPSNYSVLLGPHLDFTITKDDLSSDPLLVLAQIE